MSVPSTNKKFKRKSREPKRLFSSPEPDLIKSCHGAVSDDELPDAAAAAASEVCRVGRLLPLQRQLMMSQEEAAAATAGILTGLSEDGVASSADGHGRHPEVKAVQQTRRLLANARERTRVHTISAAFEALRKQVPCYSYGQKLSKLAILRIACNYILSLAQLAELDYSPDHGSVSFSQCVEQCTRTLQAEGRSKKRKVRSSHTRMMCVNDERGRPFSAACRGRQRV
uniref:Protein atonal homolog 8 n=1 Tax=Cynoglossus semilaevis TaxID=244447 RepID=A0A3P8WZY5_CYNSE